MASQVAIRFVDNNVSLLHFLYDEALFLASFGYLAKVCNLFIYQLMHYIFVYIYDILIYFYECFKFDKEKHFTILIWLIYRLQLSIWMRLEK